MSRTPEENKKMLEDFWALSPEKRAEVRREQIDDLNHDVLIQMSRLKTAFEEANDNVSMTDPFLRGIDEELGIAYASFLWEFYQTYAMAEVRNGVDNSGIEKVFVIAIACGWELGVRYMEEIQKDQSTPD